MNKKLISIFVLSLMLSGCFGSSRAKFIIVETEDLTAQIIDEKEIEIRAIDPESKEEIVLKKKIQGGIVLSPSTYRKLLKAGLEKSK
jgi:hypothetical protein